MSDGRDVTKRAIINVIAFVSGRNNHILISIIAQLLIQGHSLTCADVIIRIRNEWESEEAGEDAEVRLG